MGDRVTYLRFDVRDLSEDAVASAELRLTPDGFPRTWSWWWSRAAILTPGRRGRLGRPTEGATSGVGGPETPDLLWDGNPRSVTLRTT